MCTCDAVPRRETVVGARRMDIEEDEHYAIDEPPMTPDDVLERKLGEQDFMDGQRLDIEATREQLFDMIEIDEISLTKWITPQFLGNWVRRYRPPPTPMLSDDSDDEAITPRNDGQHQDGRMLTPRT